MVVRQSVSSRARLGGRRVASQAWRAGTTVTGGWAVVDTAPRKRTATASNVAHIHLHARFLAVAAVAAMIGAGWGPPGGGVRWSPAVAMAAAPPHTSGAVALGMVSADGSRCFDDSHDTAARADASMSPPLRYAGCHVGVVLVRAQPGP